jgi:hypothetical protein
MKGVKLPLYMDIHRNVEGLITEAVTGAHQKDLEIQGKYGVTYLKYSLLKKSEAVTSDQK